MSDTEFPPNSDKSKLGETEEKRVKQVTSTPAIRRKKGIGKQFKGIFFGGDARSALQYGIYDVVIPAAKEMIVDFGRETLEKLVLGQSRRQRGAPPSGASGYISYDRYSMGRPPRDTPRQISRRARSYHQFDEIILETRQEAEDVLDSLFELTDRFGFASVADLYELVGVKPSHTDQNWGWEDLRGTAPRRARGGYLLDLPDPEPLN